VREKGRCRRWRGAIRKLTSFEEEQEVVEMRAAARDRSPAARKRWSRRS
jgi:hypothetical protein